MNPKHDVTRHAFVLLMTLVAGCVDAIAFVNAGVFPANMSGNTVVLAISWVNPSGSAHHGGHAGLVMLGFCVGSALASLVIQSERNEWSRSVNLVIFFSGIFLLGWGISLGYGGQGFSMGHLFTVAMAMGMQSATILHLNFPGAGTTTAVTSTLTTMVSRTVRLLRALWVPGYQLSSPSPWFPMMVFFLYLFGALIGGLARGIHTMIAVTIAGWLLIAIAFSEEFSSKDIRKSS